jgi:hypothetical protein
VADQIFRGQAEHLVGRAIRTSNRLKRARLLEGAQFLTTQLHEHSTATPPPIDLEILGRMLPARIALARGNIVEARTSLEMVEADVRAWADPHVLAVFLRLLAAVSPSRSRALLTESRSISRRSKRWQEWLKGVAASFGVYGNGRLGPLELIVRDGSINAVDWIRHRARRPVDCREPGLVVGEAGE